MKAMHVQNLGKAYCRYGSEWRRIFSWFGLPFKPVEEHWVLRGVSFSVEPGEAIGIVGQNGAGKSTLLKLITGTIKSTEGSIQINGRIAAMLELGIGFNPEFTGRQNAWHSLGLMGFTRAEIECIMPDVEAFAELGEYFDQPVRTYSSGMQARVAFSVATAFRPDVLIVDEVLSVGDAAFQRKCFGRIERFMDERTSLLFVSHAIESVRRLCAKALFLDHGAQVLFDDAKTVCDEYERFLFGPKEKSSLMAVKSKQEENESDLFDPSLSTTNELSYTDGCATIETVWLENKRGGKINVLDLGCTFFIKYRVRFNATIKDPIFAFLIKTIDGISLYGTDTKALGIQTGIFKAGDQIFVSFQLTNHLAAGIYFLNCGIRDDMAEQPIFIHRRVDVLMFKVRQDRELSQAGIVNLGAEFFITRLSGEI
jgi:lipopolysaccharide transport system ATP-binding protein